MNVPDDITPAAALLVIARTPRLWLPFLRFLGGYGAQKARFHVLCWRYGYSVREVRRLGRLYRLTGTLPGEAATH